MSSRKNTDQYALLLRFLHWVMALLIIIMLGIGLWMKTLESPKQNPQAEQQFQVVSSFVDSRFQSEGHDADARVFKVHSVTDNAISTSSGTKKESLKSVVYGWHKRIGLFILSLLLIRLLVRICNADPQADMLTWWQQVIAKWTHALLYGLMLTIPLSGWLMSTYGGFAPRIFSIKLALPFKPSKLASGIYHEIHTYAAYICIVLVVLHIAAAIWHYLQKDGIFSRISLLSRREQ